MQDAMGLIFTDHQNVKLGELTMHRTLAALPLAGRYRMIDFVLSNMVNSGIINVGVTTQMNYQSLMDHIGTGKPWDLNRKQHGLFLLPPNALMIDTTNNYQVNKGRIDILYGALDYIRKSRQRYIILSDCHTICNIEYEKVLDYHRSKGADVTIIYKEVKSLLPDELRRSKLIGLDETGRVTEILPQPKRLAHKNVSMNMYIMERLMLERLIEDCVSYGEHEFVRGLLAKNMDSLDIYGYKFDGYSYRIDDIRTYYNFNMSLLDPDVKSSLFRDEDRIYTKVKDKVPTRYGADAVVGNSMIADGCVIEGTVEDSIISRGVRIAKGARVKSSIIMQDTEVNAGCSVENVILDKEVIIKSGTNLLGHVNYPIVIAKRMIV